MMSPGDDYVGPRKKRRVSPPETASYVLRPLLNSVPLTTDDSNADAYITCVEFWSKFGRMRQYALY